MDEIIWLLVLIGGGLIASSIWSNWKPVRQTRDIIEGSDARGYSVLLYDGGEFDMVAKKSLGRDTYQFFLEGVSRNLKPIFHVDEITPIDVAQGAVDANPPRFVVSEERQKYVKDALNGFEADFEDVMLKLDGVVTDDVLERFRGFLHTSASLIGKLEEEKDDFKKSKTKLQENHNNLQVQYDTLCRRYDVDMHKYKMDISGAVKAASKPKILTK